MKSYIQCFEKHRVTRYMHILYCQGGIFLHKYGAFGIWSAQAMEKSYWREKNNYMAKTNKGGGVLRICPLYQLTLLSFRNIMHRANAAKLRNGLMTCTNQVLAYQKIDAEQLDAEAADTMLVTLEGVVQGVEEHAMEGLVVDDYDLLY
jgi:hypothetical protein